MGHAARQQLQAHKSSTIKWLKKNEVKFWNGVKVQTLIQLKGCGRTQASSYRRKHTNIQSLSGSALRNVLKFLYVIVQDWSAFTRSLPSVTAAKGGHTRYWKQRFTYFCNAQICNTGSFFSINKWQRKYFSLTCLIQFSCLLSGLEIWWCFGSYLCRNIENSKGFTNFQAALYI